VPVVTDKLARIYFCIWADVVVGLTELRKKVPCSENNIYLRGKYKQYWKGI